MRLINRSLDSAEALQDDIDNARWKVKSSTTTYK